MQDEIETALRRWDYIRPVPGQPPRPFELQEISQWLSVDVSEVTRRLLQRDDFRELACAPISRLCRGPNTVEGCLIAAIDAALISTARNLFTCLQRPAIRQALESEPSTNLRRHILESIYSGTAEIGDCSAISQPLQPVVSMTTGDQGLHPDCQESANLAWMTGRPWQSLTSEADYFVSHAQLNLTAEVTRRIRQLNDGQVPQIVDFDPRIWPSLQLPNDFIFKCFEVRVEYWWSFLMLIKLIVENALERCGSVPEADRASLREAWSPIEPHLEELRRLWNETPEAAERRAAIQLVQIYSAYHPESSLEWLGYAGRYGFTSRHFRDQIEVYFNRQIGEYIALALMEIGDFYRRREDVDLQIQRYARTHRLCVIEGVQRRDVYWEGELLTPPDRHECADEQDVELLLSNHWFQYDRAWILLSGLAESALLTGQGVDSISLRTISLRSARGDLRHLLPRNLSELIIGSDSIGYRLDLRSAEIYYGWFEESSTLESLLNQPRYILRRRR